MRRRRGFGSAILGLTIGFLIGTIIINYRLNKSINYSTNILTKNKQLLQKKTISIINNIDINKTNNNLVFVGVMTAEKYLSTRAKAVFETWGKTVPGNIAFFSSEYSLLPDNCPNLPLVTLPTVDDGYPPQKKSFLMLQYMWNNFGDKYEWFIRADDDVYIRTDRLEKLLKSIDSKKAWYIGQAGRGNSEEFGLLSLEYDENFCMGGPGVIFSRETLRRIVEHTKDCLKNLYTTHEDVELGRCVKKYAGIPCTWSYEMQSILYHNSSGEQAFSGNLKRKEVHRAITLHPVKSPQKMYRLHNYMKGLKIQDYKQEILNLHRDIYTMAQQLGMSVKDLKNELLENKTEIDPLRNIELLGVPAGLMSFKPTSEEEVVPWDFLARSEYSLTDSNPRRRIHSDVKEGLEDITRQVMDSINACSRQRGRIVEERSALYGYRRVDAYGADTILDLLLVYRKYRGKKVTLPVRRHVYVHQHFTEFETREIGNYQDIDEQKNSPNNFYSGLLGYSSSLSSSSSSNKPVSIKDKLIKFILPLSGRHNIFKRFLNNYKDVCVITGEKTELIVILYPYKADDSMKKTIELIKNFKLNYKNSIINIIINDNNNFSRANALNTGVSLSNDDDLLFFIDVDIVFKAESLVKIRYNTIIDKQIYFPIVFSQFNPKIVYRNNSYYDHFTINEDTGYWRQFGFGIVSIYKRDYLKIGGFNTSITGWGQEDVDFFEKSIKSNIKVFRSPDVHLIHVYHDAECDSNLSNSQLSMCKGTREENLGSTQELAKIIYNNPNYLKYASDKRIKLIASGG